jgi:hypothetical protein
MGLEGNVYTIKLSGIELFDLACHIKHSLSLSIKNHFCRLQQPGLDYAKKTFVDQKLESIEMMNLFLRASQPTNKYVDFEDELYKELSETYKNYHKE